MKKEIFNWKWRLHEAGISQKQFCECYGFNQSLFSDWIRGKKQPRYDSIERVEKALKALKKDTIHG